MVYYKMYKMMILCRDAWLGFFSAHFFALFLCGLLLGSWFYLADFSLPTRPSHPPLLMAPVVTPALQCKDMSYLGLEDIGGYVAFGPGVARM